MGATRCLIGLVCAFLATGCVESNGAIDAEDLNLDYETASGPSLPPAPAGATCVLIQRGTLGQVADTDIGYGNGTTWPMGNYPYTWTGPSPYDHWSLYRFDLGVVPANADVVLGVFSNYGLWSEQSSTVRAHAIAQGWDEATSSWSSFTDNGAQTGWDPAVVGTFDPSGVGYHSLDITGVVQSWHSGAAANNGLLLEEDPVYLHTYVASEASSVSQRPSLYVCWIDAPPPEVDECSAPGQGCGDSDDCCEGLSCIGGECGLLPPPQACSQDYAPCGLNTPCCNANSICDGVCFPIPEPSIGDDGGGNACFPIGAACEGDADCCSGQCLDGVCTSLLSPDTCIEPDKADAEGNPLTCSPDSPCCEGSSCVLGLCYPDDTLAGGACQLPGKACDPDAGLWCCWNQWCVEGACQ